MARTRKPKPDLYALVNDQIIAALEAGTPPWVRPWKRTRGGFGGVFPVNASTGREYKGINVWLLFIAADKAGYPQNGWMTFLQAKGLGGTVRKGQKATSIVFWNFLLFDKDGNKVKPADAKGRKDLRKVPILIRHNVFNVAQCEGLPEAPVETPEGTDEAEAIELSNEAAAAILGGLVADGCPVRHGGSRAFYAPALDAITMPPVEVFDSESAYWSTALHEGTHATGHESRNARAFGNRFGSEAYAFEELVAELGSAYLCAHTGIAGKLQHAEYLGSWIKVLKGDKTAIFTASREAQAAAEWLIERASVLEVAQAAK